MRETRGSARKVAILAVTMTLLVTIARAEGLAYRKVIEAGEQAPDTPPGTVFAQLTGFYIPPVPQIDEGGSVAFFAIVSGPGIDATNNAGVWSEASGALRIVAREADAAPGAEPGVVFAGFPDDFGPSTPTIGSGRTSLNARLSGPGIHSLNDEGVWAGLAGGLSLVAQTDDPAPGAPAGSKFASVGIWLNRAGDALLPAKVNGPGVTTANDEGYWTDRSGQVELIVREGDPAPGTPAGTVFGGGVYVGSPYTFEEVRFNDQGELAFQGNLVGAEIDTFGNEALFVERDGTLALVLREGDPAPGAGPGVTFGGNSVVLDVDFLTFNDLGQVAFNVRLGGSIPTTYSFYSNHTGSLLPVVWFGDPAPGTDDTFALFGYGRLSDAGRLAFRASLSGAGSYPPLGIWWDQAQAGVIEALVVPGDPVPGRPQGTTFLGTHAIIGYNAAGQLLFSGAISDAEVGSTSALVLAEPDGAMHVVARGGEPFDVSGDGSDLRTVSSFIAGGLTEGGVVPFLLEFADGSSGIFTATASGGSSGPGVSSGLSVTRGVDGALELAWDPDCGASTGYSIYRGDLAAGYASLQPVPGLCSVVGTSASVPAAPGRADFFLVVPNDGSGEGSYGIDSAGYSRPAAASACLPQSTIDACAP